MACCYLPLRTPTSNLELISHFRVRNGLDRGRECLVKQYSFRDCSPHPHSRGFAVRIPHRDLLPHPSQGFVPTSLSGICSHIPLSQGFAPVGRTSLPACGGALQDTTKNRVQVNLTRFFAVSCGERGIRTPGPVKINGFQDRRIRPLCHLSSIVPEPGFAPIGHGFPFRRDCKGTNNFRTCKFFFKILLIVASEQTRTGGKLQSQSDEASVTLFLRLGLFLLEGIEVVGYSQPEHAAFVVADVGQVENDVVRADFPSMRIEYIGKQQRDAHRTFEESLLYAHIHMVGEGSSELWEVLRRGEEVLQLDVCGLARREVQKQIAVVGPAPVVYLYALKTAFRVGVEGVCTQGRPHPFAWQHLQ